MHFDTVYFFADDDAILSEVRKMPKWFKRRRCWYVTTVECFFLSEQSQIIVRLCTAEKKLPNSCAYIFTTNVWLFDLI